MRDPAVAERLAARDRWLDLLRGASIVFVVVGHWLVADLTYTQGELALHSSLAEVSAMWPITWVFQVIPVFFFVAGAVNGPAWQRCVDRGDGYASFVDRRVHRVWVPTAVMLVVVTGVALTLQAAGGGGVAGGGAMLLQPLWFLAVYLVLISATPWTWRLYRRHGVGVFPALLAVAVLADIARVGLDLEKVGLVNVVVVWLIVYLIGHAFALGQLGRQAAIGLVLAGSSALVLLVTWGPYPPRMVGVPGDRLSNMHPPTLAVLALGCAQIGLLVLLRPWLTRRLEAPRLWAAVVWLNLSIMTLYLWHQFAMVATVRVLLAAGLPQPPPGEPGWWLMRASWVVVAGGLLLGLVALFGRFERLPSPPLAPDGAASALGAGVAVALLVVGLLGLAGTRITEALEPQHPLGLGLSPFVAAVAVLLAGLVLRGVRREGRSLAQSLLVAATAFAALALGYRWVGGAGAVAVAQTCSALAVLVVGATLAVVVVDRRGRTAARGPVSG
jgi:fucose 4-O-acetylase-like acetyltransferase